MEDDWKRQRANSSRSPYDQAHTTAHTLNRMFGLQELFAKTLNAELRPAASLTRIIAKRLQGINIELTPEQLEALKAQLSDFTAGSSLQFDLDDDQIATAGVSGSDALNDRLREALADLASDVDKAIEDLPKILPDICRETAGDVALVLFEGLKEQARSMLHERSAEAETFASALKEKWGSAIDLLEMQVVIATEINEWIQRCETPDRVRKVLIRLHARACQIVSEIIVLLRHGYADGAHARWRSLHEIAVVGYFIAHHGDDVADRYLSHHIVESYRGALQYQKYADRLGEEKMTDEEMRDFRKNYDDILSRYGTDYKNPYGWAAAALKKSSPTFSDIEEAIGLDHLRPYYKMASHNVHAGPKGFFKLGLFPWEQETLLTGPSHVGLADPGQSAAISLGQITTTLVSDEASFDALVLMHIVMFVGKEAREAFIVSAGAIEDEIAALAFSKR